MKGKDMVMWLMVLVGIYFLVFHAEPFPFNHNSVGLPPFHMVHAGFGVVLLVGAAYMMKKK